LLKEYETTLTLEPLRSNLLLYFLLSLHLTALFAVFYADLHIGFQLLAVTLLFIHYSWYIFSANKPARLLWLRKNEWQIYYSSHVMIEARLSPLSFLSSWLVILVFKADTGRSVTVVLPHDGLEKEQFRQLKLRMVTLKPEYLKASGADE